MDEFRAFRFFFEADMGKGALRARTLGGAAAWEGSIMPLRAARYAEAGAQRGLPDLCAELWKTCRLHSEISGLGSLPK